MWVISMTTHTEQLSSGSGNVNVCVREIPQRISEKIFTSSNLPNGMLDVGLNINANLVEGENPNMLTYDVIANQVV